MGKEGGGDVKMLRKIYQELVTIRKELQAIRSSKEPYRKKVTLDGELVAFYIK